MALIKGKQIESINATQVVESDAKKFVSQADIDTWNNGTGGSGTAYENKTIIIPVIDGQTEIQTGIMLDGTGSNFTDKEEFAIVVNGLIQSEAIDYTHAITNEELIITWLEVDFALEATDVFAVTYSQLPQ